MRLLLARLPTRLDSRHPQIIEEMVALNEAGKGEAVTMMIRMLADLHQRGRESRYLKAMKSTPIKELKPRSRGGLKGGSRVYLFITEYEEAGIVTCEVKESDAPDPLRLKRVLRVVRAHKSGVPVLSGRGA